jgi:hypothetical protein
MKSKIQFQLFLKSVFSFSLRKSKSFTNISADFATKIKIMDIFKLRMNRAQGICHKNFHISGQKD